MEILFGDNSQEVAECYFWLSRYYVEMTHYEKAKQCMIKAIQIKELESGAKANPTEQIAEVHMNLGQLFKK
jgi:TolA-binding protein